MTARAEIEKARNPAEKRPCAAHERYEALCVYCQRAEARAVTDRLASLLEAALDGLQAIAEMDAQGYGRRPILRARTTLARFDAEVNR